MARNPYDNRRSTAVVTVNSSFILQEFKRNISKGFYGDKELERLTRRLIMELWRRDPALLEDITTLSRQKYSAYMQKNYGGVNFKKNLIKEINERKLKRAQEENERRIKENEEEVLNSIDEILGDIKNGDADG